MEWKKTVESHVDFSEYVFLTSDDLEKNNKIVAKTLKNKKVVVFLTLQDLQGEVLKDKHKEIFKRKIDLLIIDDLGTELTNSFTNSELFNILNTRLLSGKKTIISTNLSPMQWCANYAQRIFSRIFDRFKMVKFIGKDLRWESKQ